MASPVVEFDGLQMHRVGALFQSVSFGKRLQEQLNRQTSARQSRLAEGVGSERQLAELRTFLETELELFVSMEEARLHCDSLVEQRKQLIAELSRLQKRMKRRQRMMQQPPAKVAQSPSVLSL